jgi:glycosyltransferase involved in cell wall biosynthesis
MKVCIPERLNDRSGKHKFLKRLVKCFNDNNIKIVDNDADILLHIGRNIKGISAKKTIMRVDGLILNKSKPYEKNNRKIVKYIDRSDALIYQGDFCKNAYQKFLGVNKKYTCIQNGAEPNDFLDREIKNYYFTYCHWRPHKRLKNICDGFIKACENGLDSMLFVAGDIDGGGIVRHPNVKWLRKISSDAIKEYLAHAISTIHLAWLDWCPNAMVESIVAGCPIVYSDSGGSAEVGRFGGVPIKDVQWDYKPTFLYDPPQLDLKEISDALFYVKNNSVKTDGRELDIKYIAKQYIKFFEEVLSCPR